MAVYIEHLQGDPFSQVKQFYAGVPVNTMRNLAIAMARTDVVGIVDADFVVGSHRFAADINGAAGHAAAHATLEQQRALWIMPALEYNASAMTLAEGRVLTATLAHATNKSLAIQQLQSNKMMPFHLQFHLFTQYDRWAAATQAYEVYYPPVPTSLEVQAATGHLYEPYVLAWRANLPRPLFDERFRGYHLNKAQGLAYLAHRGFKFYVHSEAYVVHYPHTVPKADRKRDIESEKSKMVHTGVYVANVCGSTSVSTQLERIWDEELSSAVQAHAPFVPVVSAGTAHLQGIWAQ